MFRLLRQFMPIRSFVTAALMLGVCIAPGCRSQFKSNYSYSKLNAQLEARVRSAGLETLNSDTRVQAILTGDDSAAAEALQAKLDAVAEIAPEVNGVIAAAILAATVNDADIAQADMTTRIAAVDTMFEVLAEHADEFNPSSFGEGASQDAARDAMTAYADDPTAAHAETMSQLYWNAATGVDNDVTGDPDSVANTVAVLNETEGAETGVDEEAENPLSGIELLQFILQKSAEVLTAAEDGGQDASFQQATFYLLLQTLMAVNAGSTPTAALVATRTMLTEIPADTELDVDGLTEIMDNLIDVFVIRQKIADSARASATSAEISAINSAIAKVTQQVSHISSKDEVDAAHGALETAQTALDEAAGNIDSITEALESATTTMAESISADSGSSSGSSAFDPTTAYFVGYSTSSANVGVPGYWRNGAFTSLEQIDTTRGSNPCTACIEIVGSDVYIAGYNSNASNVTVPGYWKNGSWNALSQLDSSKGSNPVDIRVIGDDIYVIGGSVNSSNVRVPGYWKNGTWTALSVLDSTKDGYATRMIVSGSTIYVAGFSTNSSNVRVPGYWTNGSWTALPPIDSTKNCSTNRMELVNSDLYIIGNCTNSSGVTVGGYWKNGTWNALPKLEETKDSQASSLRFHGSDMYITGYSFNSSNGGIPTYWKNGTMVNLTPLDTTKNCFANMSVISGSDVYVVGSCFSSAGVQIPGYWKNDTWTALPGLDSTKNSNIGAIGY